MIRKQSLLHRLVSLLFVFVLSFSFVSAHSEFVVDQTNYDETSTITNTNTSAASKGDVTVSFKNVYYDKAEYDWENIAGHTNVAVDNETKYNALKNYFSNNIDSDLISTNIAGTYSIDKGTYGPYKQNIKYYNFTYRLIVETKIERELNWKFQYNYYGKYTLQCKQHSLNYSCDENQYSVCVKQGNLLARINYIRISLRNGYIYGGLKTSLDDTEFVNENEPVSSDSLYYVCFYKTDDVEEGQRISITKTINSTINTNKNPEKNTVDLSFYIPTNDNSAISVAMDPTYNKNENKFYLGDYSIKTNVNKNVVVRFVMNNGKEKQTMDVNAANVNFEPENKSHTRQYTVALANDLIVDGAFTIGGHVGTNTNAKYQSQINNEYVCLDLNGHDITVNSTGELWSYGLIKDSVGTGRIIVKGGKLYTVATVMDYRGGSFTSSASGSANVFPFLCYEMPYIRAKVIFEYTSSGWGRLVAFCYMTVQTRLDIGDLSHSEFKLSFIGPDDGFLFKTNGGTVGKSRLIFDGYTKSGITSEMCLQHRVGITMENMSLTMASLKFTIASVYSVDTSKYNFPVNGFFDVRLVNSTLLFGQRIQFMSGMSFIADKDSTVVFQYSGDNSGQLSVLDRSINYYANGQYIETDNVGDKHDWGAELYDAKDFWKYYSEPKIKIYGKLLFTKGNKTAYKLVGPVDFEESNVGVTDGTNITMFTKSDSIIDPFAFLKNNGVTIQTYGYDYQIGFYDSDSKKGYQGKSFSRPLVSNGKAYAVDSSITKIGTYSFVDGIFRVGNECYYFNNDGSYALGDTAGCTMKSCTYDSSTHLIDDNGTKYIYFASMYGKYDTSGNTVDTSRCSNTTTSVKVKYITDRWLRT